MAFRADEAAADGLRRVTEYFARRSLSLRDIARISRSLGSLRGTGRRAGASHRLVSDLASAGRKSEAARYGIRTHRESGVQGAGSDADIRSWLYHVSL